MIVVTVIIFGRTVVAGFIAGAAEELVRKAAPRADIVLVERQGSLNHPAYSG